MADRAPNAEERVQVETALKALDFVSWDGIELEDDGSKWEIDDARDASGQEFDVDLKSGSFELIKKDSD